jgi:hypothetical protein
MNANQRFAVTINLCDEVLLSFLKFPHGEYQPV